MGWFAEALDPAAEIVPYVHAVGDVVRAGAFADLDGLLVGGGSTPAYTVRWRRAPKRSAR